MCDITISNFGKEAATTVMPLLSAALYLKFRRVYRGIALGELISTDEMLYGKYVLPKSGSTYLLIVTSAKNGDEAIIIGR